MSIELIEINGKSQLFDYETFNSSIRQSISSTCSDAKFFLLNNFPATITTETTIDLILIIAILPRTGNYIRYKKNDRNVYLHNLILPIKFIRDYINSEIHLEDNELICNDELIDYTTEITAMRFSLINYLYQKCGFKKDELFIHPLIFIQNANEFAIDNYLISKEFNFHTLSKYFQKCSNEILISYRNWKTEDGYSNISGDIEIITEQASKDSAIGYLTKKKIERIGKQLSNAKKFMMS